MPRRVDNELFEVTVVSGFEDEWWLLCGGVAFWLMDEDFISSCRTVYGAHLAEQSACEDMGAQSSSSKSSKVPFSQSDGAKEAKNKRLAPLRPLESTFVYYRPRKHDHSLWGLGSLFLFLKRTNERRSPAAMKRGSIVKELQNTPAEDGPRANALCHFPKTLKDRPPFK